MSTAIGLCSDAVVVTDRRGSIQYVNSAFERTTGFSREEAVGRDLHILDSGRHDQRFYENMRRTLGREGIWRGRLISKKKDGVLFHEECIVAHVKDSSGEFTHLLSIRRDVTEILKLESLAAQIDCMKNSGYILSGVRHEIGNAVNSVGVILDVLKAKFGQLDARAIEAYVESASEEAQKAAYLVRCLRSHNFHAEPELQSVNLPGFLSKFLSLVRDDFSARGVDISVSISGDAANCHADPRALHQVLLNLLVNASDALAKTPNPRISISAAGSGDKVRVRVEDNGCGMSEEQQRSLFTPFYTTKGHGTGLGLVIVRKLLLAMNGAITVASRAGKGTTVDILVPRERTATEAA
jgi:PAS domain S-box-containing protein